MTLTIKRSKWLRGQASMLMLPDGCGCVIGHYMAAVGVPKKLMHYHYGFGAQFEPYSEAMVQLGEFVPDEDGLYFSTTPECDQAIGVNDGDPRSIHDFHVAPVDNDAQREAVLIRIFAQMDCDLVFVGRAANA